MQIRTLAYRALLAALGGALVTLSLAPIHFWLLVFVSPALLYYTLKETTAKQASILGWCYGAGLYGSGASWVFVSIHTFGDTPFLLSVLMTAAFAAALALIFALQAWAYRRWFNQPRYTALAFIGLWVVFEWLRSWVFTGFPWLYLGYALTESPFRSWAPIGGVWLLSLGILTISIGMLEIVNARSKRTRFNWAIPITLFCLAPFLTTEWTTKGDNLKVDIVQANIPQHLKWDRSYLPEILGTYTRMTETQTDAPIIIWPETAISTYLSSAMPYLVTLFDQLENENRMLISGYPAIELDETHPEGFRVHNSLGIMTNGFGIYHKQRLVPFGEYVPFERQIRGLISFFDLPMSGFSLPEHPQSRLLAKDTRIAAAICYEIAYPELVRSLSADSDWILTLSNDTWFSHSLAPAQHLQIAQMRALENGRWVVRSTNNGLTALINPLGEITNQAPAYQKAVLKGEIEERSGVTPYQQTGVLPVLLISFVLMGIGFRRRAT